MTLSNETDFNDGPYIVPGVCGRCTTVVSHKNTARTRFKRVSFRVLLATVTAVIAMLPAFIGFAESQGGVAVVSAASFDGTKPVAADSIVAAFGGMLATDSVSATTNPLPTTLGGTAVEVNGRQAELFFVSPGQINFVIPAQTETGTAEVTVRSSDGTISQGTVVVTAVAPAVFTASATGQGVPAGSVLRVKANGQQVYEPLFSPSLEPIPIDLGPEGETVFLVLYLTGIRGAADTDLNLDNNFRETIHVVIDGQVIIPDYAGKQNAFVGLDQINARIPRNLIGRGKAILGVTATGFGTGNVTEIEIAGAPPPAQPHINSFAPMTVLAGGELSITGTGFSPNAAGNTVELLDQDGQATVAPIASASASELKVRVPFGTGSGRVKVTINGAQDNLTGLSTDSLSLTTSISGFMQDDRRQPLAGAKIKVVLGNQFIETLTTVEGSFILGNVPPAIPPLFRLLAVDPGTIPGGLQAAPEPRRQTVLANRDNLVRSPIELKGVFIPSSSASSVSAAARQAATMLQSDGASLDIPANAVVQFPDGTTGSALTLSVFAAGRTPANLPAGHFSSSIVQISPFGATITPGARLTLPNSDQLPAGSQAKLFRFDQTLDSPTVGTFVESGIATVSADGQRVVTAANAITETTYYFASILRPTATLLGRVLDSDGKPTRLAIVQARGQATFTDGLGGFALRGVAVMTVNDQVTLDVSFLRADGRVDRSQLTNFPLIPGGITEATSPVTLPSSTSNRAPTVFAPATLSANQGGTSNFSFVASDPDAGQTIQVTVSGAPFATIIPGVKPAYVLRLTPGPNDGGTFNLTITATDNLGETTNRSISLRINRLPTANAQSVTTSTGVARAITLTGSDADGDQLSFLIVTNPLHGVLSGTAPNLTYTPAANYSGVDSFTFKVSDGLAESPVATIGITVNSPAPTITSLDPNSVTVGGSGFTLAVNGTGFVSNSLVRWNGASRATTFVSATRVTAQILPADIASAGTASVTVLNAAPGGGTSAALTFTINNPTPVATNLNPTSTSAGGMGFTLTLNGTGFVSNSVVRWNGAARSTTFVNAGQLTAQILEGDLVSPGTANVMVFSPAPGGGTSNALLFTVNNPMPAALSLGPEGASAGGPGFTLLVNGAGFVSNSVVRWNGSNRSTTFVHAGLLTAQIPGSDIASSGTASVTVFSQSPGGGTSNELIFTINNPTPTALSLNPDGVSAGGPGFTLTVNGSGFVSNSVVRWNGSSRATTFVHPGQLTAQIPDGDIASTGSANITIFNPGPGGGTSNQLTLPITNPMPFINSLDPNSASEAGSSLMVTVRGTGFVASSVGRWNGSNRVTTFISSTQLTVIITSMDRLSVGMNNITVFSPGPGGGTSNQQTFTIVPCFC